MSIFFMTYENLLLTVADGIATVSMNRPPVNAQNRQMRDEFIHLFDALGDRDDVRVVILTGAGDTFSAGADIKERVGMMQEPGDYTRNNRLVREFFYAARDCAKPVIAAVNGAALGAGCALAFACDIVIASDNAFFAMPEINVGLAGGAGFLMEHLGRSKARAMYFTGRRVPAAEFHRLGAIEACVPRTTLMDAALEIARDIAAKSPLAARQIKRTLNTIEEMPVRDAYRYEQSVTVELSHSEDAKEAQRAFIEKRKPVFKGK
jgi:enoyl-CoA hydratase